MGQFRATENCPVCQTRHPAGSSAKWTCPACKVMVDTHRELLRHLQQWRSLYEAMEAPDVLVSSDTTSYSLWDVQTFYDSRLSLAPRQQQAIQYCLYENMKERDASVRMGIGANSPCSIYATVGITTLLAKAVTGDLPGYFIELPDPDAYPAMIP